MILIRKVVPRKSNLVPGVECMQKKSRVALVLQREKMSEGGRNAQV